ncbi:hypothetical protein ACFVH6_22140 [Spirillospora sp. NPDC127200]
MNPQPGQHLRSVNLPNAEYRAARNKIQPGTRRTARDAVLAYPDLAARLCEDPIGYARPDQWNGYVPPEIADQRHNNSPRREALAEIVAEAHARDAAASEAS